MSGTTLDTIRATMATVDHYGRGRNGTCVTDPAGRTLYFSYRTLVAVRDTDGTLVIRRNDWGVTTGGHLNAIDGGNAAAKARRLKTRDFDNALSALFS